MKYNANSTQILSDYRRRMNISPNQMKIFQGKKFIDQYPSQI